MARALGWLFFAGLYAASIHGAVMLQPIRRWTAPRELVVLDNPLHMTAMGPISFEGWTLAPGSDGSVEVQRGARRERIEWATSLLVRSDEIGSFLDADPHPHHPCGHSQRPRFERRVAALFAGGCALVWLCIAGGAAQGRLNARRRAMPASTPTYRMTGRPTIDDTTLWRAVERDAREVTGAVVLVVTWALVVVGVL